MNPFESKTLPNIEYFTPLNERVSYHVTGQDDQGNATKVNIHLADCHDIAETKEKRAELIEDLYRDGLKKLANFARENPTLESVDSTSWLNATKTYGDMKRRLGFTDFGPISDDLKERYFADETRPVVFCSLSRQELLSKYGEQ